MNKITGFIVNRKILIIIIYTALVLISLLSSLGVSVNFNLADYLPEEASSKKAIQILEDEYENNGSANLFIEGLSISEVTSVKKEIKEIDGVKNAVWLDDVTDINIPLDYINNDLKDNYYKDGYALIQLLFEENDYNPNSAKAIIEIEELIGENGVLTGPAVASTNLIDSIGTSIIYGLILILVIIIGILILSTTSYFEVLLFLITIGVSVLINNGTNIIFGEISFITSSASAILQIAIAMDYSIFLLHRFSEEKKKTDDPKRAMALAIKHSMSSISASAVTTMVGFLALTFMSFRIGFDMGLVLAKGILISMITIMTLLPVLALLSKKPLEKTTHKNFLPSFRKMEKALEKGRYVILVLVVLIAALAFMGQSNNQFLYGAESSQASDKDNAELEKVTDVFGSQNMAMLIVPNDDILSEANMVDDIKGLESISDISGMYALVDETIPEYMIPQALKDQFISENYSRYFINLKTKVESEQAFEAHEEILAIAGEYFDEYYITGQTPSTYDIKMVSEKDYKVVNTISIVAVGLILLITFKSILLPLLLLFIIQASIWMNMAIPYYMGTEMLFIGYLIVSSMQLGATIDYAILLTNRFKASRQLLGPHEAAVEAITQVGGSIFTSATILGAAGIIIGLVFDQPSMSIMGTLIGRGALISGAMVMFALPQLLVIFDPLIKFTTLKWPGVKKDKQNRIKVKEMKRDIKIRTKKRSRFKVLSMFLILLLIAVPTLANAQTLKDETVYVELNYDGSIETINVVNRLYSSDIKKAVTDYGEYSSIKNLVGTEKPKIDGDKISWVFDGEYKNGFYYQGTIEKELPYTFEIKYYLNGRKLEADELAGKSGRINIEIEATQNEKCAEEIRSGIMAQIALNLDLENVKNIVNKNVTKVIAGKTMTLSYTILEGSDANFTVSFDAEDFEMNGMNITLLKSEITMPDNIQDSLDEIEEGFTEMSDGMDDMIEGTRDLKSGLRSVSSSAKEIDDGLYGLDMGAKDMAAGIGAYKSGLEQFELEIVPLATGSTMIKDGLSDLAGESSSLEGGYDQWFGQLMLSAQNIVGTSSDPNAVAFAQWIIDDYNNVGGSSFELSEGLETFTAGAAYLSTEYDTFDSGLQYLVGSSSGLSTGITDIHDGAISFKGGVTELSSGMHSYYVGIKPLPSETQKLIDGQEEFKDGIDEANEEIQNQFDDAMPNEQTKPVSFTSPTKNKVSSVQYIMLTPSIEIPEKEEIKTAEQENKNIWERFLDLFRK